MKTIEIDGAQWKTAMDAIDGLRTALNAAECHGNSIDAFIDSMIYGGMLGIEPPYEVAVRNVTSPEAKSFIRDLSLELVPARAERMNLYGDDVRVAIILVE